MTVKDRIAKRQRHHGLKKFEDMTDQEARELALEVETKGDINIVNYFRPRVVISKPDMKILAKWNGGCTYNGETRWEIQHREQLRPFLRNIQRYLKPSKQEDVGIALRLLDVIEAQSEGWRAEAEDLVERLERSH